MHLKSIWFVFALGLLGVTAVRAQDDCVVVLQTRPLKLENSCERCVEIAYQFLRGGSSWLEVFQVGPRRTFTYREPFSSAKRVREDWCEATRRPRNGAPRRSQEPLSPHDVQIDEPGG